MKTARRKMFVVLWWDHVRDAWRRVYRLPGWSGAPGRSSSPFALRPALRELYGRGFSDLSILVRHD